MSTGSLLILAVVALAMAMAAFRSAYNSDFPTRNSAMTFSLALIAGSGAEILGFAASA